LFMPYKDELEIRLNIDFKATKRKIISKEKGLRDKREKELKTIITDSQEELNELQNK
jgi:hypothetical protein